MSLHSVLVGASLLSTWSEYFIDTDEGNVLDRNEPCFRDLPSSIQIREIGGVPIASAHQNFYRNVIYVGSNFLENQNEEKRFVLLHEVGHIVHNDMIWAAILDTITIIACAVLFPTPVSFVAGTVVSSFVVSLFHRAHIERNADAYARENASDEVLRGGISIFTRKKAEWQQQWESADTVLKKMYMSGCSFIYYTLQGHPSEDDRIAAIQQELRSRSIQAVA